METESYRQIMEPYSYPLNSTGNKTFLGNAHDKKCIFCGKTEQEVTFKKEAHVIPAALGNRTLFNLDECDRCNEDYFSIHENELVNFLMMDRIFIRARKRSGSPKYKPSKGESFIEGKTGSNHVHLSMLEGEDSFEIEDFENENKMVLTINDVPPYCPADVCKCLTHMGWSLLSEEKRKKIAYVPEWLLGKIEFFPLYLDIAFVPGNGYSNVILELWESVDEQANYPIAIRFTFGLKILTFYLPGNPEADAPLVRNESYFQIPEGIDINVDGMKILNNERLKPGKQNYTWRYRTKGDNEKVT
ncbi:HNH endonuclease [Paenibacillus sp. LMG 31459]|uniref:HNH endonuclease n=1 Tax=Paenibacillus phytohabitans TaxID=2654978 RepID=A0ABX1YSN1_9BACL|nr:HNH endonuclease [Paenibacillus phytohabitans]NOU83906.1 HNH endonuclease [Paenibacillus phytohabitans]